MHATRRTLVLMGLGALFAAAIIVAPADVDAANCDTPCCPIVSQR